MTDIPHSVMSADEKIRSRQSTGVCPDVKELNAASKLWQVLTIHCATDCPKLRKDGYASPQYTRRKHTQGAGSRR
jgi:hypothetical protein